MPPLRFVARRSAKRSTKVRADEALAAIASDAQQLFALPRKLIMTDRILQRWAVSTGSGLPSEEWDDKPKAKLPPLPDDVAIDVDQCILSAPPRTKDLVTKWYKTPEPTRVIATRLRMSERNLKKYRQIALEFMRWRLEEKHNPELTRMITALDN